MFREWYEQRHNQVFSWVPTNKMGLKKKWATTNVDQSQWRKSQGFELTVKDSYDSDL